jgi:sec-independent protein translocase protein TatC
MRTQWADIVPHLEELRDRLIKSLLALAVTTLFSFLFTNDILRLLIAPMGNLQPIFLRPTEMFVTYVKVALLSGVALAMPVIIYQFARFVIPALETPQERRYFFIAIPGGTIAFIAGLLFAYFVLLPFAVKYLLTFGGDIARAQWTIGEYISFVTTLLFWMGVVFEIPLIIFFLTKLRIVSPRFLAQNRKFAVLAAFMIGAIITPTPDPFNQTLVALPLVALYEVGIWLSKLA